ncbi:hypothetical protein V6N13_020044 [Hibiscus sabdariffa]
MRNAEEKPGLNIQRGAMSAFSDFIDDLSMLDLPLLRGRFTWSNLRESPSSNRIDRFLLSHELASRWPSLIQQILPRGISDHNPITLSISSTQWGPKQFKWFDHWGGNKELFGIYRLFVATRRERG